MTNAYQLNNISFHYNAQPVLAIAELSIGALQTTAVLGPNGSGKSTLLNLLAFLHSPSTGTLYLFDQLSEPGKLQALRKRIGWLAQKSYLLRGTVTENIELALKLRNTPVASRAQRIQRVLDSLNIGHLAQQHSAQLSGGEKQKVALARTLAIEPEVLILDEPFSYLDQAGIRAMESFIEQYDKTLIFSTHTKLQGQALADAVITLINGQPVQTPLINLFHGQIKQHQFHTDKISITMSDAINTGKHIAIDPNQIVISQQPLVSSMRNHFQGRITAISEAEGNVHISIVAEETFIVLITHQALQELQLTLGSTVWVNFKSNAVSVF